MTGAPCFPGCLSCALDIGEYESIDAWKTRIRATLRRQQARHRTAVGRLRTGRPRGDARVLAALKRDVWMSAHDIAPVLRKTPGAAAVALHRAVRRGLAEYRRGAGYRLKARSA
jgi:hypothetical protein